LLLEADVLLAIDTATKTIGVGIHDGSRVLAETVWSSGQYHTVELAPEVALLLRRVKASPHELSAVAVVEGPGSYTGLRIGMALAKGLALVHNLPLVGIPTFEPLVRQQPRRPEPMLSVIEAGRKRIVAMWYKWGRRGWKSQGKAFNSTWDEVIPTIEEPTYVCGDIPPKIRARLEDETLISAALPSLCIRRPSELAELAWESLRAGKRLDPAKVHPVYLSEAGGEAV
jgi:tRNA threonylcarbamoyladenosine biosynthesis protein TsaB